MTRVSTVLLALCLLLSLSTGCNGKRALNEGEASAASSSADKAGEAAHSDETAAEHAGHEHAEDGRDVADPAEKPEHEHAEDEAEHADEEPHGHEGEEGGHAGHAHADLIALTPEQLKDFGVQLSTAAGGNLDLVLSLPGEVAVNADKTGHVLPRLPGVVQKVTRNIGDSVRKGELLVVLDSRELAEAKSVYLSGLERVRAAKGMVDREQALFEKGVSPEQDLIAARNNLNAFEIELNAAEQSLHAIGVSEAQMKKLAVEPHSSLTRYEVYAPVSGRILEKHVSPGEMVSAESELFLIADLSSVWVKLSVSQKDLPSLQEGQQLLIQFTPGTGKDSASAAGSGIPDAKARISYIDALVAEDTRTATARVALPNPRGLWKPGLFVSGLVSIDKAHAAVLVPLEAIVKYEGQPSIFVRDAHGFEPRVVEVGRESATQAEILSGLEPGESYVSAGAYMVKAEFGKSEASHEH